MTSKHQWTAGPWSVSEMTMSRKDWAELNTGKHPLNIVRANWDGFTGDVIACVWADDDGDEAVNARLIAAAPALYEALEQVLAVIEHPAMHALWLECSEKLGNYHGPRFEVENLRAALQSAHPEGEGK